MMNPIMSSNLINNEHRDHEEAQEQPAGSICLYSHGGVLSSTLFHCFMGAELKSKEHKEHKEQLYSGDQTQWWRLSQLPVSTLMLPTLTLTVMSQEYAAAVLRAYCMQALRTACKPLSQGPINQRAECRGKAQRDRTCHLLLYNSQITKNKKDWSSCPLSVISPTLPQKKVKLEQICALKQMLLLIGFPHMEMNWK